MSAKNAISNISVLKDSEKTRGQILWERNLPTRKDGKNGWERLKLVTESYWKTEGLPIEIRRSESLTNILSKITIYIEEDQLLCGDWATKPSNAELLPEMNISWIRDYLISGQADAQGRGAVAFEPVSEKEHQELIKMCDYWMDHSVRDACSKYLGEDFLNYINELDELDRWFFAAYAEMNSPKGWNSIDFSRIIDRGVVGLLADIDESLKEVEVVTTNEELKKQYFLKGLKIALKSLVIYANRYADLCREEAEKHTGKRRKELLKMAEVCSHVPEYPARNFHEALQSLYFADLGTYYDTCCQALGYGRVDQYLYPYYKADIEAGRATVADIMELLECFRVKINQRRGNLSPQLKKSATPESHFHNCVLGGVDKHGRDATNELSFLWLKAAENVHTPHPTLSVRWHPSINKDFMFEATKLVRQGLGFPAFFNDETGIEWLMNRGVPLEQARNYSVAGCVLQTVNGTGYGWPSLMNLGRMTELAMNDGADPRDGKQFGPHTGKLADMKSVDDFFDAVKKQIKFFLKISMTYVDLVRIHRNDYYFELIMSALHDDCIKVGKSVGAGGAKWKFGSQYILPVGIVDLCNSAMALKELVIKGDFPADEMLAALKVNFEGYDELLAKCKAVPKYGNDIDEVDYMVADMYNWFCEDACKTIPALYGEEYAIAPHSIGFHADMGRACGALPSGRPDGVALADGGCSPSQGTDTCGPAAVIRSAGKLDHSKIFGTLFNMRFLPSALQSNNDIRNLVSLIETFFGDYSGKHIQFNVVDTATLKDARENPENYGDLIVRVAGYSALWTELGEATWTDLIRRSEQSW